MQDQNYNREVWTLAEEYISGTMSQAEKNQLSERLVADPDFAEAFQQSVSLIRTIQDKGRHHHFRALLSDIKQGKTVPEARRITWPKFLQSHHFRTAAVAAGIALLTSVMTVGIVSNNEQRRSSQYQLLKRELETIRRSHNALVKNIHQEQVKKPETPANYSGTGFALNNQGVFLTNYHVTSGADSVFIQTDGGMYHKAHLLAYDEHADIAILRVDDKKFRFSKSEVPYTLAPSRRRIGARVYTLGFPGDAIVFSQGYISSRHGFMGDSLQYRLELPANPGQSGAPVIDVNGYVVGVVTGLENGVHGTTTYAVSSEAIRELLKALPEDIRLPKNNRLGKMGLEDQIELLESYTCAVKVYKR